MTTVPAPVIVRVLPLVPDTVAGPETTLKVTGRPESDVAFREIGVAPYATAISELNVIVCGVNAIAAIPATARILKLAPSAKNRFPCVSTTAPF